MTDTVKTSSYSRDVIKNQSQVTSCLIIPMGKIRNRCGYFQKEKCFPLQIKQMQTK